MRLSIPSSLFRHGLTLQLWLAGYSQRNSSHPQPSALWCWNHRQIPPFLMPQSLGTHMSVFMESVNSIEHSFLITPSSFQMTLILTKHPVLVPGHSPLTILKKTQFEVFSGLPGPSDPGFRLLHISLRLTSNN